MQALPFGFHGWRLTKVYADGRPSEYLTDDEIAVWEHVRWLEEEVEQYRQVTQGGRRLPDPDLRQDPAFAAFVLGKLEQAAGTGAVSAEPVAEDEPGEVLVAEKPAKRSHKKKEPGAT